LLISDSLWMQRLSGQYGRHDSTTDFFDHMSYFHHDTVDILYINYQHKLI